MILLSWSGQQDSNLRPGVPKTPALPDCAIPRQGPWARNTHAGDAPASIHASADSGNVSWRRSKRRLPERLRCRFDNQRINARRENAFRRPDGPPTPPCPWHRVARPGASGARRYHHMTSLSNRSGRAIDGFSANPLIRSLRFFNIRRWLAGGLQHPDNSMPSYWFRFGVTQYTQGGYIIYVGRLYYIS